MAKRILLVLIYFVFIGAVHAEGLVGPENSSKEDRQNYQRICLDNATGERSSLTGFNEELMDFLLLDKETKRFLHGGSLSGPKNLSEDDDGVLRPWKGFLSGHEKVTDRYVYCLLTFGYRWEDKGTNGIDEIKSLAEKGNASAQATLGLMYYEGRGVGKNYSDGADWLMRAANNGHINAQYNLAVAYGQGNGVATDLNQAIYWMDKAASQGHAEAQRVLPLAQRERDRLSNIKPDKSVSEYLKAAENGDPEAMFRYGMLFEDGYGVKLNMNEAIKWYRKSAEKGFPIAQTYMGVIYDKGRGVRVSYPTAFEWYKKGAESGDAQGQYNLGIFYLFGHGTTKNEKLGNQWIRKAANNGYEAAKVHIKEYRN